MNIKNESVTVIIPAAGSGLRMGGVYKPLEMLCGKPIIWYSLGVFQESPYVKSIVIAAREDKINELHALVLENDFTKVSGIIAGGKDRQESVEKAFRYAFSSAEKITPLVAVHDAARPLITAEDIMRAFTLASKSKSAVCAQRVRDTVKKTNDKNLVTKSVDREGLWLIQTPQVFDTDLFHTALSVAKTTGFRATDDSSLVIDAGFKVMLCETPSYNIKITYDEDVALAQAILMSRSKKESL